MNAENNLEYGIEEALEKIDRLESKIHRQIEYNQGRSTGAFFITLYNDFLEDLKQLRHSFLKEAQESQCQYSKGFKAGCRETEKLYNPQPDKFREKEAFRNYWNNECKLKQPNLT
jgi:hypothetical protein